MARTKLTVHELEKMDEFSTPVLESGIFKAVGSGTYDAEFEQADADFRYLILVKNTNSAAKKATILHGDGIQGVGDVEISLAQNQVSGIAVNSGRFKVTTGADKGKVIIKGESVDISVAVFKLP